MNYKTPRSMDAGCADFFNLKKYTTTKFCKF